MAVDNTSTKVDVLIIGAGPTGLLTALWMAQLGIKTRIVDKRGTRILNGHADGFHCRTLEVLHSFDAADTIFKKTGSFLEWCVWVPGEHGGICRLNREPAVGSETSRIQSVTLHQGHVEAHLLNTIKLRSGIEVERGIKPTSIHLNESEVDDADAYPITVNLHHLKKSEIETAQTNAHSRLSNGTIKPEPALSGPEDGDLDINDIHHNISGKEGSDETIQAKYVVGCEGAHSWTRRELGFVKEGDSTDSAWGVIDVIPVTDWPDIRKQCTITSRFGTMLNVPREKGLTRLYIQIEAVDADKAGKEVGKAITPESMFATVSKIMAPYKLTYTYCDWWTVFRVGQRVSNKYSSHERIFLAGDAVHSHSPNGGQGMNVSMQDAFNLGWKIAGVVKGQLHRSILKTYESERRPIAQQLIAVDRELSHMLSSRADEEALNKVYEKIRNFLPGTFLRYEPSSLVADDVADQPQQNGHHQANGVKPHAKTHLTTKLVPGMRVPSYEVARQSNACIFDTQDLLKADGSWRLLVFGGDVSNETQLKRVNTLGENLATGLLKQNKYPAHQHDQQPIFKPILIHSAPQTALLEMSAFHSTFFPFDDKRGHDYDRIHLDVRPGTRGGFLSGDIHGYFGIDPRRGCVVVVRPDQYVSFICEMEDVDDLDRFFDGVLVRREA